MTATPQPSRLVDVPPQRIVPFLERFERLHGAIAVDATSRLVTLCAVDGSIAECLVPFPPLAVDAGSPYAGLVEHVLRERRVGVVLVRRGGYAAGVFDGDRLVASKVGSRHVQARTAAGGWSQQRYARRRGEQARAAWQAAADAAAGVLMPAHDALDAVVVGGDRSGCDEVLADPRLRPLQQLLVSRRLDVADPRLRVLEATPAMFRAMQVRVTDTTMGAPDRGDS